MFTQFIWNGESIDDIQAWATARNERMVAYVARRVVVNMAMQILEQEEHTGEMPESFWHNLRMADGWSYIETARK